MKRDSAEAFRVTADENGTNKKTQLRSFPADPTCKHNVKGGKCFCMDKGAEYIRKMIEEEYEEDLEEWAITDQGAPFHDRVMQLSRECTYSQIDQPLLEHIPSARRLPGVWHCIHNCRGAMWLLIKDAAARYKVIMALKAAMSTKEVDLPNIKCAASARPRSKGPGFNKDDAQVADLLDTEAAEAARVTALTEEERNQGIERTSMDGMELIRCLENFTTLAAGMEAKVSAEHKSRFADWRKAMEKALKAFNKGAEFALADIWHGDKSQEMGNAFREWFDTCVDEMGSSCGLPYEGREYVNILPAHWLTEPDHLQEHASWLWRVHGVTVGSGSDAVMEMVTSHS